MTFKTKAKQIVRYILSFSNPYFVIELNIRSLGSIVCLILNCFCHSDELELPSNATKSLSETILEKDIAIIDTTGIKEAEICIAAGNESLISSGYQATQGNVPDYSQADLEMMQDMTTSEAESEDVKSVVEGTFCPVFVSMLATSIPRLVFFPMIVYCQKS